MKVIYYRHGRLYASSRVSKEIKNYDIFKIFENIFNSNIRAAKFLLISFEINNS